MDYFAYGSNMDVGQMAERCPGAVVRGVAILTAHRLIINVRGYATVVPDMRSAVHGLLWQITAQDESSLDDYEGVSYGLYQKESVRVRLLSGGEVKAMIYVASNQRPGMPKPGYLEQVLAAAESIQLPPEHIEAIRRLGG